MGRLWAASAAWIAGGDVLGPACWAVPSQRDGAIITVCPLNPIRQPHDVTSLGERRTSHSSCKT